MTRVTANLILLIMAGVWAYLSIITGMMQPVSENFIYLGVLIAGGEVAAATDLPGRLIKKKQNETTASQ